MSEACSNINVVGPEGCANPEWGQYPSDRLRGQTYGRVTVAVGGSCSGSCERGGGCQFFIIRFLG